MGVVSKDAVAVVHVDILGGQKVGHVRPAWMGMRQRLRRAVSAACE